MRLKLAAYFLILILACAPWAAAQSGTGIITGRVSDPSGGVVPGAKVTVTSTATDVASNFVTNQDGYFESVPLAPGIYQVSVAVPNFKTLLRNGIIVQVEDRLSLDLKLQVGQISETVVITAESPQLRTQDAETGEVIDQRMIDNLPSNNSFFNRDPLLLLSISGDVQGSGQRAGWNLVAGNGGGPYSGPADTRINGGRTSSADYLVDGVSVSQNFGHVISNATPAYDDVSEFKVVTNGISAEYGRLSGGAVSITTKSGTNDIHGQAFMYYQADQLNANSWQNNWQGAPRGNGHKDDFGGTLGGPLAIPKVYNGRQKTFWFVDYEGVRQNAISSQNQGYVLTAQERMGNLSDIGNGTYLSGTPTPYPMIYDPFGPNSYPNLVTPTAAQTASQPWINGPGFQRENLLPNNGTLIPSQYLDPVIQKYIGLMPLPNHDPVVPYSQAGNFVYRIPESKSNDVWSVRMDQVLTQKQNMYFRYNRFNFSDDSAGEFSNVPTPALPHGFNETNQTAASGAFGMVFGYNYAISPTLLLEARVGGNYSPYTTGWYLPTDSAATAYLASFPFTPDVRALLGSSTNILTISTLDDEPRNVPNYNYGNGGYQIYGDSFNTYNQTNFQYSVALTKILGRHSVKFGYEGRRYYDNFRDEGQNNYFSVDGNATQQFVASNNANNLNWANNSQAAANATGQFLMGIDTWMQVQSPNQRYYRENYYSSFVQDDFKVTPRLTLNLGLRWETESPLTEKNNKLIVWNANAPSNFTVNPGYDFNQALVNAGLNPSNVATPSWVANGFPKGAFEVVGSPQYPSRNSSNWHPWNFAPRLGAAYQVTPVVVVRGSFAMLYLPTSGDLAAYDNTAGPTFTTNASTSSFQTSSPVPDPNNPGLPFYPGNLGAPQYGLQTLAKGPIQFPTVEVTAPVTNGLSANFENAGQYSSGIGAISNHIHMPLEYDWSFGIQRQLPWNMLVEAQYLGNHSSSLLAKYNPSVFPANLYTGGPTGQNYSTYTTQVASPINGQGSGLGPQIPLALLETPYPYFGYLGVPGSNLGTSNFNAVNLRFQKRFSDGLEITLNYTISKLLDDVGGPDAGISGAGGPVAGYGVGGKVPQSVLPFTTTYGLDPLDQTHRVSAFYNYQLPVGRGRRWMNAPSGLGGSVLDYAVGGWTISGSTTWHSGTPITFTFPSTNDNNSTEAIFEQYSSLAAGASYSSIINHSGTGKNALVGATPASPVQGAFNLSAFATGSNAPLSFTLGNLPLVYAPFRNPGLMNTNLSLLKNLPIFSKDGTRYLQLRLEALNAFNHPGLGSYDSGLGDSSFGLIKGVGNGARQVQIAAKFVF
jgi:hypothetical protein